MPFLHSVLSAKIWECLIRLSLDDEAVSNLNVQPTLLGERHQPDLKGTVTNIDVGNLGLGQVFRALCRGLLENLHRYVYYLRTWYLYIMYCNNVL